MGIITVTPWVLYMIFTVVILYRSCLNITLAESTHT